MRRFVLVVLALAVGSWLVWGRGETNSPRPPSVSGAANSTSDAGLPAASARAQGGLPPSLRGTQIDGALVVDGAGHFRPTTDALDFFDYFLAASGEESKEALRSRILAAIDARLEEPARAEAKDLLERYLAYRESARSLYTDFTASLDLERRFQLLRELRREAFGDEVAEALFGAEEARWRVDLDRRRIAADESLSPDERARALEILEESVPESVRATQNAALAATLLRQDEARLRAEGASPAEIHALRERRFGEEAADRLATLDTRRAEWGGRVSLYNQARDELLAEQWDSPDELEASLDRLRSEHFSGPARHRIEALDRMAQLRDEPDNAR